MESSSEKNFRKLFRSTPFFCLFSKLMTFDIFMNETLLTYFELFCQLCGAYKFINFLPLLVGYQRAYNLVWVVLIINIFSAKIRLDYEKFIAR